MSWSNYKWRFTPSLIFRLGRKKNAFSRQVIKSKDSVISHDELSKQIINVLSILNTALRNSNFERSLTTDQYRSINQFLFNQLNFELERKRSNLENGGIGVFIKGGNVAQNRLIALYPGTLYIPGEPAFLVSLNNSYIFRCADGFLIDGKNTGISKLVFRSCTYRDRLGPYLLNDMTWMTHFPANPLAIGQFVNNATECFTANVCYQEMDLDLKFVKPELRRFLPYTTYGNSSEIMRIVALVTLRDIEQSEELYSNYYTLISDVD